MISSKNGEAYHDANCHRSSEYWSFAFPITDFRSACKGLRAGNVSDALLTGWFVERTADAENILFRHMSVNHGSLKILVTE